jgi:lysyl-tRNA synthetase class II
MSSEIINITLTSVSQKVDAIVKKPRSTYDSAFLNEHLRKKLIVKVLNQVLPHSGFSDEKPEARHLSTQDPISVEQEQKIEHLVHQNIYRVLQEENALPYFVTESQPSVSQAEPSHWFG